MAVLDQSIADEWAIYLGDCMEVMPTLPTGSVALSIYSPPFGGLYHYSSSERDHFLMWTHSSKPIKPKNTPFL